MSKYDAIVVLGAVMEWNERKEEWAFPTIIQGYVGKLVAGKARALAAREIQNLAPLILVTGGSDKHPKTGEIVSRSVQLIKLMTEKLGMPKEKVVPMGQPKDGHTLGNAENLVEYIKSNSGLIKSGRIAVLTPRFQYERAKLMFDANPYFRDEGIKLEWIIVEEVLVKRNPHYKRWIDAVYATPEAEINRKMEERGIKDFKSGQYKPKT